MIHIQSPFLKDIPQCRVVMRKLRKKIYKYTSTHRPTKKPKDSIHDILTLLKPRKLPDFLVDSIKKRRNFDLSSIKNVVVPQGAKFSQMKSMGSQQEQEIEKLFKQHRSRMRNLEKKNPIKFQKRLTAYSSTEEESQNEECSIFQQEENAEIQVKDSENIPSITHDSQDNQFRDDYCVFRSHGFLALEKDLYSEEEWLKF